MTQANEQVIHQLAHGYDRGHRLLATSASLPDEVMAIVNRASDAVPRYRPSTGPYLAGYGLPDGSYALARTWPAVDAKRPNTVWTHTFVIPPDLMNRVSSGALAQRLQNPATVPALDLFRAPIAASALPRVRSITSQPEAAAGVSVYRQDRVLFTGFDAEARDRLALALWDQHWPSARLTFRFCTAIDASFDGSERSLSFTSREHDSGMRESSALDPVWRLVIADLMEPTRFRDWLHFVGSGERNHQLIETFAAVYLLLNSREGDDRAITEAERLLEASGPAVTELRRLKRSLLSFEGDAPKWAVSAPNLLHAVASRRLGEMIAADDASLDRWIARSWIADSHETASLLKRLWAEAGVVGDEIPHPPRSTPRSSARDGLHLAFRDIFADLLTASMVPAAANIAPERLLDVLIDREDPELWRAWADLPGTVRKSTLAGGERTADWSLAITSIRSQAEAVRDLLKSQPSVVHALIEVVARRPRGTDAAFVPMPGRAARLVRREVENASALSRIRALCYLATSSELPSRANWMAWQRAVERYHDELVPAIAYLLGRRGRGDEEAIRLVAMAYAALYASLADTPAELAWSRLGNELVGRRDDWDRCQRLTEDLTSTFTKLGREPTLLLLNDVESRSTRAAQALMHSFERKAAQGRWKLSHLFPW